MKQKHFIFFYLLIMAVILISSCSDASINPDNVWRTYENQQYGYSFDYPADCTFGPLPTDCKGAPPEEQRDECLCFLNLEDPERVVMQTFQTDGDQLVMAEFSVAHLNTPANNPPDEPELTDWLAENFPDKWEDAKAESIKIDGVYAVSISNPASAMAPALEEIYFIHNGRLFQISMLNVDVAINHKLYESILTSFRFDKFGAQPEDISAPSGESKTQGDSHLEAELSAPESVPVCDPIELEFRVTNHSDQAIYLLNWYTPLEGVLGNIFQVSYEGQQLSYLGPLVMRAAPLAEQYILLEPGGSATAVVDVSTAYDFSAVGNYVIAFKSPQISHIVKDVAEFATSIDVLGPVQIPSQPVEMEIVAAENGAGDCAANGAAPPVENQALIAHLVQVVPPEEKQP